LTRPRARPISPDLDELDYAVIAAIVWVFSFIGSGVLAGMLN
jgi:hypothetical protein